MSEEQPMLTKDRRCGQCGETVTEVVGEPHMRMEENGFLVTLSVAYLLKPCGHAYIEAVR